MSKLKIIVSVILFLSTSSLLAQTEKSKNIDGVKNIVFEITSNNIFESSSTVGVAGTKSGQNALQIKLEHIASNSELIELAESDSNGIVRLYAIMSLVHSNTEIPKGLIEKFENDYSTVILLNGCIADYVTVSQVFKQKIYPGYLISHEKRA